MKNITFLTIILLISGCKTLSLTNIEDGIFMYKHKDGNTNELILNKNGTFRLIFHYENIEHCESTCKGQWEYVTRDAIVIQCNPASWTETIERCYMSNREYNIKVLDGNRLKMYIANNAKLKYVILERVDSLK